MWKKIKPYVISVAIALIVGGLSAWISGGPSEGYEQLNKPPLSPPSFIFPSVWSILFILIGIGSAEVYERGGTNAKRALSVYAIQLFINFMWSIFFFKFNALWFSFIWLLLLIVFVFIMIYEFSKISTWAAKLQIPYLLWIVFAAYLNLMFAVLNP